MPDPVTMREAALVVARMAPGVIMGPSLWALAFSAVLGRPVTPQEAQAAISEHNDALDPTLGLRHLD